MPRGDKTGPMGEGQASGRGLGDCESNPEQEENLVEEGRGLGLGRGRGPAGCGRGLGAGAGRRPGRGRGPRR